MMKKHDDLEKIRNRIPVGTLNIEFYDMSSIKKKRDDFEDIIDKRIFRLKKQGVKIENYLEYFQNVTEEYISGLLGALETEHYNKKNMIKNLLRRRISDKTELEGFLENIKEEIRLTEIEYENLKEIYDKHNPLENGMLKRHNQYNDKGLDGMNKGDEDEYK